MKRLLASICLTLGCGAQVQRATPPEAPLVPEESPGVTQGPRIAPLAGLGSGVRRVDVELR